MKMKKQILRLFAVLLCLSLLAALTACNKTEPSADPSGGDTSETPKTDTEKLLSALDAYETYFNDISDVFGAKLADISENGKAEFQVSIPVFSIFGESQNDMIDTGKPVLQATVVRAGDLASAAISAALYGEQMRIETYESAKESYLVFPDLHDQAPIRLPAGETAVGAGSGIVTSGDTFKKLLESLEGAEDGDAHLTITEDGDTCTYTLRLTAKQIMDLVKDAWEDLPSLPSFEEGTDPVSDDNYMLFKLTTAGGLPTELQVSLYDEGKAEAASEFLLKTSVTGSNTNIDVKLTSDGETQLTINETVTATQGSIVINSTLEMGEIKITENLKFLSETENSITVEGTAEARIAVDGGAAFTLPMTVTGKISADGDARKMELELSTSSANMFDLTMRFEARFTPGNHTVTMPNDANSIDADQVDTDALAEALTEAYPKLMEGLAGGDGDDWTDDGYQSYMDEDGNVLATIYDDGTIELSAFVFCDDDGKSMTFTLYGGTELGSYPYKKNADGSIHCFGMDLYSDPELAEEYVCQKVLYYTDDAFYTWVELSFYEPGDVTVNLCMPYETVDGVTKILLPDGTAFPYDVILPEDELSPLQIGSMTLPRYVDSDPV